MSLREMVERVGQNALMRVDLGSYTISIPVKIVDVRVQTFGRTDFEIHPTDGKGGAWVSAERITFYE